MVSLRGLMFCRRSKFSIRRTPKFLTWNGRSPKKKTPSASSLATTRRPCLWDARWWSSPSSSLMSSQVGIWSYGAPVSQPICTGGALRGNLEVAKSQHQQALISYRQTIQRAFGDVSDALIGYEKFHQVRVRQEDTVK